MIELLFHVCVQEGLIAFSASPKDIVLCSELFANLQTFLNLCSSVGKHMCIFCVAELRCISGTSCVYYIFLYVDQINIYDLPGLVAAPFM